MALTSDPSRIPYELRPEFEPSVVRLLATSEDFWERAGKYVDPELLGSEEARLIGKAVAEICKEGGHPARSGGISRVVQRLQRWSTEDGRLLRGKVGACYEYLVSAPELPSEEVASEIAPSLKRQLEQRLAKTSTNLLTAEDKEKARGEARRLLDAVDSVGKGRTSRATFGALSAADIAPALRVARLPRIPIGIPELDVRMGGGPQLGCLGVVSTYAGYGKSTLLTHHLCSAARLGIFGIYLTGEMTNERQRLRTICNLTSVPMRAAAEDEKWAEEMAIRYHWLVENRQISAPIVHPFKSTVTKAMDLFELVEEYEAERGERAKIVLVDADEHVDYTKVDFPGLEQLIKKSDPGTYEGFGRLYAYFSWQAKGKREALADNPDLARVVVTASQVKGEPNPARFKTLVGEEMADSKRKIRIVDWCVTVNPKHAEHGNVFFVAKGRHDGGGNSTPVLADNWACGQMVKVEDPYPWVQDPRGWRTKQRAFW